MEKPFTLKVEDLVKNIAEVINNANLPAYVIKNVLEKTYQEVDNLDRQEINEYNSKQKKDKDAQDI